MTTMPRGCAGHVLAHIQENATHGRYAASLLTIAIETGYSLSCVSQAIRQLQADYWITVLCPGGPCRPACYGLVAPQHRVAHLIDRAVSCSA